MCTLISTPTFFFIILFSLFFLKSHIKILISYPKKDLFTQKREVWVTSKKVTYFTYLLVFTFIYDVIVQKDLSKREKSGKREHRECS